MKDLGCSSNAARFAALFGNHDQDIKTDLKHIDWSKAAESFRFVLRNTSPGAFLLTRTWRLLAILARGPEGAREVVRTRCERGAEIASMLGLPDESVQAIRALDEHWDARRAFERIRPTVAGFLQSLNTAFRVRDLHMRAAVWSFLVVGLTASLTAAQEAPAPAPPLSLVLSRAATYVETFADRVSGFVTAESYVQDVFPAINRFGARPGGPRQYSGSLHRELKSDLLLVRPVGSDGWMQFRDVTEVDGKRLKDRNDRLAKLFLEPSKSTAAQSRKIIEESARYNIGDIERNINLPVLALTVLDRRMQSAFQFGMATTGEKVDLPKSTAFAAPADALVVAFRETQIRTMVVSPQGKNMPASGRFWLDRATSQVYMTEIGVEDLWLKAAIHVSYGSVDGINLPVPVEMHERYENKLNGTRVEGSATYSDFREFKVSVDQDIAPINDKGKQDR